MVNGYQVSQAIHVAATLGIADVLKGGFRTSDELAQATDTHPPTLYRLLRALAAIGILHEENERRFALTAVGERLRDDHPQSLRAWAAFIGRPNHWEAWGHLIDSVRTGANAFQLVNGTDVWSYRAERPEENAIFNRAMRSITTATNRALLAAYDFSRFETVVDVGGGNGALLASILIEYPNLRGVLFDQPHVVAHADDVLVDVADRCRIERGSFFESVPRGGDAYILKSIIHDWDDEQSAAILDVVRRAVPDDGVLLLLERLVGGANDDPATKFSDLNMLVAPGGRERTVDEFVALFDATRFRLDRVTPTAAGIAVVEAVPV